MIRTAKRVCAAALSAAVAFSFTAFTAAGAAAYTAEEPARIYSYELDVTLGGKYDKAVQAVYEALVNLDSSVSVEGMGVTTSNADDIYHGVLKAHPELFYASGSTNFSYYSSGEVILYSLSYTYDASEIPAMKAEFNARVDEIMSLVSEDMTDLEKAIVIHDEIVSSCNYQSDGNLDKTNAYNALVGGEAVCQGYSYAYAYLLSLAGVESEYAESDEMVHMWNKVCIDGDWYNVDATWNDPVFAGRGQVYHTYFLLSDSKISDGSLKKNHYNYTSVHSADNTRYDNALLHEIDTRLCGVQGSYYGICNDSEDAYAKSLIKYNPADDSAEIAKRFDDTWPADGDSYYTGSYMALQVYDGMLYFNTPSSLCLYDVSTGRQSTVVENVLGSGAGETDACYGIVIDGGKVYAAITDNPDSRDVELKLVKDLNENDSAGDDTGDVVITEDDTKDDAVTGDIVVGTTVQVTLSDGTQASVYYGDVNLDGIIDISDATCVQKALAKITTLNEVQREAADTNGDGAVDISDATCIQKYIAHII